MKRKIAYFILITAFITGVSAQLNVFAGYTPYKTLCPAIDTYIDTGVPLAPSPSPGQPLVITYPNANTSYGTSKTLFLSPVQNQFVDRAKGRVSYGLIKFDISGWTEEEIRNAACIKIRLTTGDDVDETRTGYTGGSSSSLYSGGDYRLIAPNDEPIKDVLQVLGLQQGMALNGNVETPVNYKTSWDENTTWNTAGGLGLYTIGNMLRGATVDACRKNTTYYIDVTDYVVFNKLYDSDTQNRKYASFKIQKMLQGFVWTENKFGNGFSVYSKEADAEANRPALILYNNDAKGRLQVIADSFDISDITKLVSNINLPSNIDGAAITWKSSDESIITSAGVVTVSDLDNSFVLEATFAKDGVTVVKRYNGTVKSKDYIMSALEEISKTLTFTSISNEPIDKVKFDLNLINNLAPNYQDINIKWSSSNPNVISPTTGKVTRSSNNTMVSLTATLSITGLPSYVYYVYFNPIVLGTDEQGTASIGVTGPSPLTSNKITPSINVSPSNTEPLNVGQSFIESNANVQLFYDVPINFWGTPYINTLKKKHIVDGDENGNYHPSDSITREESLKIIIEALSLKVTNASSNFSDVVGDVWYYPYISSARELNIINGVTKTEFGIGQPIRRQDLAVMVYNAAKKKGFNIELSSSPLFEDNEQISDYAHDAVYWLKSIGVVSGNEKGDFLPENQTTRAEIAKIICLIINKIKI